MKKKKNRNIIIFSAMFIAVAAATVYGIFFLGNKDEGSTKDSANANMAVQDLKGDAPSGDSQNIVQGKAGYYENKNSGISFSYPESYKITKDVLGTGAVNSKLILSNEKTGTTITVWENLHGSNPEFSDFIYYMSKSGGSFVISKRVAGEIPERDTESFSIIANFGDAEGTVKVNGKTMLMILNSKPNDTHENEFKGVVTSLKEI